jgi:hypothetical protein
MPKRLLETSFPPGFTDGTPRQVKQRWLSGNFVRFRDGRLRPMGGWTELPLSRHSESLDSAVRGAHAWRDNTQTGLLAFGTVGVSGSYGQLYACSVVTPASFTDSTADTTDGSADITVDDGTAYEIGDSITGAGIPADTTISAVSGNTITLSATATATASNITVTVTPTLNRQRFYNITPTGYQADADTVFRSGFGSHFYGQGYFYGTSYSGPGSVQYSRTSHWILDSFGETLVGVNSSDKGLFQWDADVANIATEITTANGYSETAPTAVAVLVTSERHVLAIGADNDSRLIRWSSQETVDEWAPSSTNTAGDLTLQTTGYAICGRRVRNGTLLFTDQDCHILSYLGSPLVYGVQRLGEGCGVDTPYAIHSTSELTVWLNSAGFWQYDGYIKPLPSPIQDRAIQTIDWSQSGLITCGGNTAYGEVIWWCPSKTGTVGQCDYYIVYNYRDGVWYDSASSSGQSRNSWMDATVFSSPLAADPTDNKLYMHDSTNPAQTTEAYAESGAIDISQGQRYTRVSKIYTDTDQQAAGVVNYRFFTSPAADATETESASYALESDGVIDTRLQGRQVRVKVSGLIASGDWTVGSPRFELHPGGTR